MHEALTIITNYPLIRCPEKGEGGGKEAWHSAGGNRSIASAFSRSY